MIRADIASGYSDFWHDYFNWLIIHIMKIKWGPIETLDSILVLLAAKISVYFKKMKGALKSILLPKDQQSVTVNLLSIFL